MKLFFFLFAVFGFASFGGAVPLHAQIDEQCPHIKQLLTRQERSLSSMDGVREQLVNLCIKENKEDFEKLVLRTEEIAKLTNEIKTSYDENRSLSDDDREKLERVEGLVKKVRSDLKASDDDEEESLPENANDAVTALQKSATDLLEEIKKTTRHTVSLVAIKSSSTVMKIVKFLRFGN
ncbi:MAG: hypothetical protein OEM82_02940 [Acidobacteriota bacterium]|nr:hypothetical protein [Acidobacteriota bacterium]MDH3529745.1 hypothetical protein [Acidobacteriota bacterium]